MQSHCTVSAFCLAIIHTVNLGILPVTVCGQKIQTARLVKESMEEKNQFLAISERSFLSGIKGISEY